MIDKDFMFGARILLFILFAFCLFIAYDSQNKIDNLKAEISELKDKNGILEDDNLYLNNKLCELKQNPEVNCKKIEEELARKLLIMELLEEPPLK